MSAMLQNNLKTDRIKLIKLIQEHQQIKKNFEIQDAYKLIYQFVFGVGHVIVNPDSARKYLEHELEKVPAIDDESLMENISITGEIVRLNLRPYKYRHGSTDRLFQTMLQSAGEIAGKQEDFLARWNDFKQAVIIGELNFDRQKLNIFDDKVRAENYPAMHHSAGYKKANQPAYRVLKSGIAKLL